MCGKRQRAWHGRAVRGKCLGGRQRADSRGRQAVFGRSPHLGHLEKDRLASLAVLLVANRVRLDEGGALVRGLDEELARVGGKELVERLGVRLFVVRVLLSLLTQLVEDGLEVEVDLLLDAHERERERVRDGAARGQREWKGVVREARRRGACVPAGRRQTHKSCTARRSRWTRRCCTSR